MDIKKLYKKYGKIIRPVLGIKNRLFGLTVHNRGSNNRIIGVDKCRMKKSVISISGDNNTVIFNDMSSVFNVKISVFGSNNTVFFGERNYLDGCSFCIEDDNNKIITGQHVYIYTNTEISAIESTEVSIGDDCLFSANIMIRTGDSHSIFEIDSGKRINLSKSIKIGNKVWLGNATKVLKGSEIGKETVVGAGSLITQKTPIVNNSVLAGMPAKVVKNGIFWEQIR